MKTNSLIITLFLLICPAQNICSQEKPTLGIINARAKYLPKPEYSDEAKNFCASGKVEVEFTINKNGDVVKAKAVSGDGLLWNSSMDAVKRAKFERIRHSNAAKVRGIVVYNFVSEKRCTNVGVVNNKARILPKPIYPKSCRCTGIVKVRIVIDMNGDVIHASAFSGHPLLRISAVEAARRAKFPPTLINTSKPIHAVAFLKYDFEASGKVST